MIGHGGAHFLCTGCGRVRPAEAGGDEDDVERGVGGPLCDGCWLIAYRLMRRCAAQHASDDKAQPVIQ